MRLELSYRKNRTGLPVWQVFGVWCLVRRFSQQVKFNVRPKQVISRNNMLRPEGVAFREKIRNVRSSRGRSEIAVAKDKGGQCE